MPKFKLNDKTYNIPENIVQEFLNDNPNAVALEKITPSQEEKLGALAEVNVAPTNMDLSLETPSDWSDFTINIVIDDCWSSKTTGAANEYRILSM